MKMTDEGIAEITVEVSGLFDARMAGAEPVDMFAGRATLITHLMLEMAKEEGALETMRMMDHQIHMLEEEHPGTTLRYVNAKLADPRAKV